MSDIFISYAREDRETAQRLAKTLEAQGWSVWWDTRLKAGEVWDEVIGRELAAARCVIVLWSKISVQRNWVRVEAEEGLKRRILVPVRIEHVEPPLAFRLIHAGDLIDWKGHSAHPGFQQLMADVASIIGPPPSILPPADRNGEETAGLRKRPWPRWRRRFWKAADFDRELAPDSLPTSLAAAIVLRHRDDESMRSSERSAALRRHETVSLDPAEPPPPRAASLGGILLKVLIYSTIAALTVIGLEALGIKILPFLNTTPKENTDDNSDGDICEEKHSVDCSVFAPPAISVGH